MNCVLVEEKLSKIFSSLHVMLLLSEWLSNIIYVFAYFMTLLVLIVFHYNFVLFDILLLRNTFDIAINMKHLSRKLWTSGFTCILETLNTQHIIHINKHR